MAAGSHGVLQLPGPLFSPGLSADERSAALVLGYADLAVEAIDEGIRLLAAAIRDYIAAGKNDNLEK